MRLRTKTSTPTAERAHLDALDAQRSSGGISRRKALGAHYTPAKLVEYLVREAFHQDTRDISPSNSRGGKRAATLGIYIDPSCGSGHFLVAMALELVRRFDAPIERVLMECVYGIDLDPEAVRLAQEALLALLPKRVTSVIRARVVRALQEHVIEGDALDPRVRARLGAEHFDFVVGNPPFLGQLKRGTAASRVRAREVARATDGAVRRYADGAAAFLLVGLELLKPGGRLAFVMPISFLSAADASAARERALRFARIQAIWSAREGLFKDANVRVCGFVFERETREGCAPTTLVRRAFGPEFEALPAMEFASIYGARAGAGAESRTWSPLLADGFGAPMFVSMEVEGEALADYAHATADFRDQYYGLRGALIEDPRGVMPLMTTKHVDLACSRWGESAVRVHGVTMRHPAINASALASSPKMLHWLAQRRVPKVLVATQTKVMEAWVDVAGTSVPLVPLLTVTPRRATELWKVAAAVASPVVASRAIALYSGSALSAGAIKLSAKQLLEMPVPKDRAMWNESARLFGRLSQVPASQVPDGAVRTKLLLDFAEVSCRAHGLDGTALAETLRFWCERAGIQ